MDTLLAFFAANRRLLMLGLLSLGLALTIGGTRYGCAAYSQHRQRQQAARATQARNQRALADQQARRRADSVYVELLGESHAQQVTTDSARHVYENLLHRLPRVPVLPARR